MSITPNRVSFPYGEHEVVLETSRIARQASAAIMVSMGDTVVLATVVGNQRYSDRDFFPLTVDYQERTYAAGKIPGGFFKRAGEQHRADSPPDLAAAGIQRQHNIFP